jgi:D-sedoheptulose 7-phosphate isomerase
MKDKIAEYRKELNTCFDELLIEKLGLVVMALLKRGRAIFVMGNGGSASTASHMAVDLMKGTAVDGGYPRMRVICLADNVGTLTAWANDASYEVVFEEQLKNLMTRGDVVIGLSVSGNSPNILAAMKYARENGATTIGFIGFGGGKLKDLVDIDLTISSRNYGIVEDFHLSLNHIISQFIKKFLEEGERWNPPSF